MTTNDLFKLTLTETLDELWRLVNHLDDLLLTYAEDEVADINVELQKLVRLKSVKDNLRVSYETLEKALIPAMEHEYLVDLGGGMQAEVKQGAARKQWDHKGLSKKVAERLVDLSVDRTTGEILYTQEEMIGQLLKYAAPSYWRVKNLKELGIDANQYSEKGDPKTSIVISKSKG